MKVQDKLTVSNVIFLLLFAISLFFSGFWRSFFYFFAFFLATICGVWRASDDKDRLSPFRLPSAHSTALALPLILPIIAATMLTALAFHALFSLFGIQGSTAIQVGFGTALIRHALLPAVFEELLFRYLPLVLLGRENPKALILTSSLFFALGHVSLVHLPYALFAGICYMSLALLTGSVWPCILTHFLNNLLSLTLSLYPEAVTVILIVFASLTVISLAFVAVKRRSYHDPIRHLFTGKSHEYFTLWPILYAACVLMLCAFAV